MRFVNCDLKAQLQESLAKRVLTDCGLGQYWYWSLSAQTLPAAWVPLRPFTRLQLMEVYPSFGYTNQREGGGQVCQSLSSWSFLLALLMKSDTGKISRLVRTYHNLFQCSNREQGIKNLADAGAEKRWQETTFHKDWDDFFTCKFRIWLSVLGWGKM